ncbi:hypothetical protein ACR5KS_03645 [Leucobacter sp. W1153]|uniref:hypothetical protein n=1 Tax=Leucobacter sp. W1153 TaxID=3439064 RepID=UPI003F3C9819
MTDLAHARTLATGPVDDSADIDALRLVVLELCDEVEKLRGETKKRPCSVPKDATGA